MNAIDRLGNRLQSKLAITVVLMGSKNLQINLLGPLHVQLGAHSAEFRTDAIRVLLAYLAANQSVPQRRDTLAGLLSPDRSDKEALTYLRNRLTRLRKSLHDSDAQPPWFTSDRKQIALRAGDDIAVDLVQFEQLMTAVETHGHRELAGCPACLGRLEAAVALVRGELLAGLNFPSDTWEAWLINRREHYQQRALAAMTLLRDAQTARSDWLAVLDVAQRQLALEVWLEAAHRASMRAHYHLGDRNAALAQYAQCEQVLWNELGVEPEDETQQLQQQILDDTIETVGSEVQHNLPLQTGQFFGRTAEKTQLLDRLVDANVRLITLVGSGGIGKTRLSIEVGRQLLTSFPDGVWFTSFVGIQGTEEQIKIAVGEAAGFGDENKQLTGDQVLAVLRKKRALLIFDNCETVLDQLDFIPTWLRRAPNITILATSREALNFQAESLINIAGLPMGDAQTSAAEQLFAERGQMARDQFALSAENLPQVRHICDLVGGSPLGISLAAAWVRRRSLPQIIASIGKSLDFLSTRLRDIDPRHRSMRAVFETSWQLLEPEEQDILAALSVFPAGFSADAAEAIANATLFDLDTFCEKSLLQQQPDDERYALHSLLRQFAADKLADQLTVINKRFIKHYLAYAESNQHNIRSLQPEWHNFSAATARAHELKQWQAVTQFVYVLDEARYHQVRYKDMRDGLLFAIDAAMTLKDDEMAATHQVRLAEIELESHELTLAEQRLRETLPQLMRSEDAIGIAKANYLLGRLRLEQADNQNVLQPLQEAKSIYEDIKSWDGVARTLNLIAIFYMTYGDDWTIVRKTLERSVMLQHSLPSSVTKVETLRLLARTHGVIGNYALAETQLSQAADIALTIHATAEHTLVLYDQTILLWRQGRLEQSLKVGFEHLSFTQQIGNLRLEALAKAQLTYIYHAQKAYKEAIAIAVELPQLFQDLGDTYEEMYAHYYLHRFYNESGAVDQSLPHKQQALQLAKQLNYQTILESLQ